MTEGPYPNGLAWRVQELERRMNVAERDGRRVDVIAAELKTIGEDMRALSNDLRAEVRYLRRVLLGLLVSITLAAIVFGVSQIGSA